MAQGLHPAKPVALFRNKDIMAAAPSSRTPPLSMVADEVRRHDRDRFVTALFAPPDRREDLFALYAFNVDVAGIREKVTEPMMGLMRLQWWRDRIEAIYAGADAAASSHPAAKALAEAVRRRDLPRAPFDALLDAREQDMEDDPPADRAAFLAYARDTGGAVQRLAAAVLGAERDDAADTAAERVGTAWAVIGLLRATAFHAAQNRVYLPAEDLTAQGVDRYVVAAGKPHAAVEEVARALAAEAAAHLAEARRERGRVPRQALAAVLPAVLADGYLKRLKRLGWNVYHPDLAVVAPQPARLTLAAMLGRY